jgi:DNA-binding beta-propeller fold protein YncE
MVDYNSFRRRCNRYAFHSLPRCEGLADKVNDMQNAVRCWPFATLLILAACIPGRQPAAPQGQPAGAAHGPANFAGPGLRADGSVVLPNQWSLRPVGRQIPLGDLPVNIAVHPDGRFAAVLHSGYSAHEIRIVDLALAQTVSTNKIHEAFYGLEFTRDGKALYCSGAGDEIVHAFDFQNGELVNHREIRLREPKQRGVPAGLAIDSAATRLFVANVWGHRVSRIDLGADPRISDIPLSSNLTALGSAPVIPSTDFETAAAEKRAEAALYTLNPADTFPYACRIDEKRQRLYVSLWAQASVAVVDLKSGQALVQWPVQDHPCEMVLTRSGRFLFVANASRNTVTVVDTDAGRPIETIWAALYPQSPPGSTPNSLALTPDERTLFVANADNNLIAVFDVSTPGKSRSLGFIPAGWYPTSVRVTPDGKRLLIANGKGIIPKNNLLGPQPGLVGRTNTTTEFIGGLFKGTMSVVDLPPRDRFEKQLAIYTAQAYRCSPLNTTAAGAVMRSARHPIPQAPGERTPIKYCLYIIKENRTYDQVLGDMPQGNGDPQLCLFPEGTTPNFHQLAREFVLLDNFYVEGEVSADGHEWTMGAYATDFVEKMWPMSYGHNSSGKFPYPSEGNFPIAAGAGGYLWDRAREAGISYRSYGEFVTSPRGTNQPGRPKVKALEGHCDPWYYTFDMNYSDLKRAERFIAELHRFESEGDMPRLQILRLPNDHTHGTTAGFRTPKAYVAENDLALGRVVEALSRSKFWPQLAVFVVEDDAQNGPDHVDAHRTTAFVVSPYTKRGVVDSTLYSTSSMLRTMELILGLKPMSQFDAAAIPMFNSFQSIPDLRPYTTRPANVDLEERNAKKAWGGHLKMNFTREDAVDDLLLNEVIWRSIKGAGNPMPAPVRAAFVFTPATRADED